MVAYAGGALLAAKLARAGELWERTQDVRALWSWPLMLGPDLVLLAVMGLLATALRGIALPWIRFTLLGALLLPLAFLLPADVVAHSITGTPITWQRLRGDEGATLADLGLLGGAELWGGLCAIAVMLIALWPAFSVGPRSRWVRRLARPRALLVCLLSGSALSLLQGALLPRHHGLAEQPLFVLLGSLSDDESVVGHALDDAQWRALHRPSTTLPPEPPPPLQARARNVVVFLAEGIGFEHTGFAGVEAADVPGERGDDDKRATDPTPNLTRRQRTHGLLFDRYYANWHASIQAIFSVVCSAFPPMRGDIVRIKPRIDCGEFSEVMAGHGVTPGLFHGGQFNFYNKLALLGQRAYAVELDAVELAKQSKRRTHQWGIDDRAVVEATLSWVDSLEPDERFAALLIPITAHYPYWTPPDFKKPFGSGSRRERFLNAVAFQDQVFEQLLRGFEERGLYDDTLFVWLGDHGHYVGEPMRATHGLRMFYEPNLKTALVLINPRMFPASLSPEQRTSHRLGSHPDLLPTLLDALGLPRDPRHVGQSLLGRGFEPRRVFFAAENAKFLGFLEGQHKFVLDVRRERTEYYDLARDPDELQDLSAKFPDTMASHSQDVRRFAGAVRARIDAAPVLQEELSVQHLTELFIEHAQVSVVHEGKRTPCPRGARGPRCGNGPPALRLHQAVVAGEPRRCVMVRLPADGSIELAVDHEPILPLLTGTIVSLGKRPNGKARFRVQSRVDGTSYGTVALSEHVAARPHHPRPTQELVYTLERTRGDKSGVDELCLQLTTLVN